VVQVNPGAVVATTNWGAAPGAAGILLFNVVFHDIIPLICEELDYNLRKVRLYHLHCHTHRMCLQSNVSAALERG
jgi:hypothetical protein